MPDREQEAPHASDLGAFVRSQRKAYGMTQVELAELAGVGTRFLSELERNKPTLRLDRVNAVLAVFGKAAGIVDMVRDVSLEAVPGDPDWQPAGGVRSPNVSGVKLDA